LSYTGFHTALIYPDTHELRPKAKIIVSAADRPLLEQFGAAVVECSWKRVEEVPFAKIGGKCERLCMNYLPKIKPWQLLIYL